MKGNTMERFCVSCRRYAPKETLIRVTRTPDGIFLNGGPKVLGRSAYVCRKGACIDRAIEKRLLQKSLKSPVPDEIFCALEEERIDG